MGEDKTVKEGDEKAKYDLTRAFLLASLYHTYVALNQPENVKDHHIAGQMKRIKRYYHKIDGKEKGQVIQQNQDSLQKRKRPQKDGKNKKKQKKKLKKKNKKRK